MFGQVPEGLPKKNFLNLLGLRVQDIFYGPDAYSVNLINSIKASKVSHLLW